jgi:hypothetical protein
LNNIICEVSRHFRNKKNEYLKERISKLKMNSKYKNIRDLYRVKNKFMKHYQTRSKLDKGEYGDLTADSQNILNMWLIYFSLFFNSLSGGWSPTGSTQHGGD